MDVSIGRKTMPFWLCFIDPAWLRLSNPRCVTSAQTRGNAMKSEDFTVASLDEAFGAAMDFEEVEQRLELGLWLFDTHGGDTACCGCSC
jgi:hypothetical protein